MLCQGQNDFESTCKQAHNSNSHHGQAGILITPDVTRGTHLVLEVAWSVFLDTCAVWPTSFDCCMQTDAGAQESRPRHEGGWTLKGKRPKAKGNKQRYKAQCITPTRRCETYQLEAVCFACQGKSQAIGVLVSPHPVKDWLAMGVEKPQPL